MAIPQEFPVYNVMGLIQQGAGHRHTGGFEDRIPVPFLSPDPAP